MTQDLPLAACPICVGDATRWLEPARGPLRYAVCGCCGHGWLHPAPTLEATRTLYGAGYFGGDVIGGYDDYARDEATHRAAARRRLAALRAAGLPTRARLADIGCAFGFGLDEWRRAGHEVVGVDISEAGRREAEARFGVTVLESAGSLAAAHPGGFDAIGLFQVLEHAPLPRDLIRAALAALRPGGLLCIETWDLGSRVARLFGRRWQQLSPPAVVHLFTRHSLAALLVQEGAPPPEVRRVGKPITLRFALEQAARAWPAVGALARALAARTPPRWSLEYPGDDLVLAVARLTPTPHRSKRTARRARDAER